MSLRLSREEAERIADLLDYKRGGFVVAVAQDVESGAVLMVGFMTREAVIATLTSGYAHYWSTSRGRLWMKGETSGNVQELVDFIVDCDGDAVLLKVRQRGAACHTGSFSCFYRPTRELLRGSLRWGPSSRSESSL
ncbi:MAG: phosphoribosyl-AMP cyclohydrolase [Fervidicoccaceae archaeon]